MVLMSSIAFLSQTLYFFLYLRVNNSCLPVRWYFWSWAHPMLILLPFEWTLGASKSFKRLLWLCHSWYSWYNDMRFRDAAIAQWIHLPLLSCCPALSTPSTLLSMCIWIVSFGKDKNKHKKRPGLALFKKRSAVLY